jgi:hypothetical protein
LRLAKQTGAAVSVEHCGALALLTIAAPGVSPGAGLLRHERLVQ